MKIACRDASHAAKCGYTSASLKGDAWYVLAPLRCTDCVGGDSYIVVSKRTGRVIKIIVGE